MRLKLLSDFYYNILKSNFIKNSFILLASQLIAKILPLISLLFAMKLYSTEDFGKFGLFVSISTITSSFANLALDNYIVLSKDKKDLQLCVFSCVVWASLFLVLQTFLSIFVYKFFFDEYYILFIGLYSFFRSFSLVGTNLAIKFEHIRALSIARILDSLIFNIAFIGLGFYGIGYIGLIFCSFITFIPSIIIPLILCRKEVSFSIPSFPEVVDFHHRNIEIPKYIASANLIETLSNHLHTILFNFLFDIKLVGQLFFVQRILASPIIIIHPITQYLLKSLDNAIELTKSYKLIRYFSYVYLLFSSLMLGIFVALPNKVILPYVTNDWAQIVPIFQIMFTWYILIYLLKIISPVFFKSKTHHYILNYNIINLVATLGVSAVGYFLELTFIIQLLCFSMVKCLVCSYFIFTGIRIAKKHS